MTDQPAGPAVPAKTFEEKVRELADLLLAQQRERLASRHSQWQADAEQVQVRPGPKYTKIDIGREGGMSGKLMIDNATGEVFGIKGYGVIHRGHRYGTLDTIDQWYWGEYYPLRRPDAPVACCQYHRTGGRSDRLCADRDAAGAS